MKGKTKYTVTWLLTYIIPLLSLLIYFYATSNKNIAFIIEAPRIQFKELEKGYDFVIDEQNIIEIEEGFITFDYDVIHFNKNIIEGGKLTIPLEKEIILNNIYYKYDEENKTLNKIIFSEEIKEATKENKLLIGLSVIIIGATFSVGIMVIIKKMDVLKEHRRLAVVISMFSLFVIFLILSIITKYIFLVFGVLFLSTSIHYIEWIIYRKANGLPIKEEIKQKVVVVNE